MILKIQPLSWCLIAAVIWNFHTQNLLAELSPEEKIKRRQEILQALNGSTWSAELLPRVTDEQKKSEKDTLIFKNGKLFSEKFSKDGYLESNFTVTVDDDGLASWETMQAGPGEDGMFWRGEIQKDKMTGIVSKQNEDSTSDFYKFMAVPSGKKPS